LGCDNIDTCSIQGVIFYRGTWHYWSCNM